MARRAPRQKKPENLKAEDGKLKAKKLGGSWTVFPAFCLLFSALNLQSSGLFHSMRQRTIPIFAILALTLAPLARATPLAMPGPVITEAGDWHWLFSAIAAKGNTYSVFTENRAFAARKDPVVLIGEMRLIPATGLSLHYITPDDTLTIIDARGLRMRDAKGRARDIKAGSRDAGLVAALLPIMRFDEENLFKNFTVHAARDGGDWRFDFVPRDAKLAAALGSITVVGVGVDIQRLSFNASAKLRVEVLVGQTKTGVVFSADDLKKYFR